MTIETLNSEAPATSAAATIAEPAPPAPPIEKSRRSPNSVDSASRCHYRYPNGRRCTFPASPLSLGFASATSAKSSPLSCRPLPAIPKTSPPTCSPNSTNSLPARTSRNSSPASSFRSPRAASRPAALPCSATSPTSSSILTAPSTRNWKMSPSKSSSISPGPIPTEEQPHDQFLQAALRGITRWRRAC